METNSNYSDARIKRISGDRLKAELDNGRIVIVAGFQGINKMGDVTTLGPRRLGHDRCRHRRNARR